MQVTGPISSLRLSYELVDSTNNSFIIAGKKFILKDFLFTIDHEKTKIIGLSAH